MMLALFDFDGTITSKDSLEDFIQYAVGKRRYYLGLLWLSPTLIGYKLKLIRNDVAKERMISYFFKGWGAERFEKLAREYSLSRLDSIVRSEALERIRWHQGEGHEVVIVSASMEQWLGPWCERERIELISTRLEIMDAKLTGRFATKNCHGEEKVERIRKAKNLERYEEIYAYGDSKGDRPMLALATKKAYKPFR